MNKYTPGPWEITWGPTIDIAGIAQIPVADDGRHTANARLISAAPELLEALQSIVQSLSDQDDEGLIEHAEPMIAARAAIAKATGTA